MAPASEAGAQITAGIAASGEQATGEAEAPAALDELYKWRDEIFEWKRFFFYLSAMTESLSLGQFEWMSQAQGVWLDSQGLTDVMKKGYLIDAEKGLLKRAEQEANAKYTAEIPSYQDLITQVVKEVITLPEFKAQMKKQGYSEQWSQRIWDAHFQPPDWTQILQAFYRGEVKREELNPLMILVDLDPRFKEIFDTRKYVDPPLNMTRFLFETGAITVSQVEENVKLQGYRPEHVAAITEYVTEFQSRLWRRRYLVTLQGGYQKGVYTAGELEKAVLEAGYTPDVSKWILANA